MLYVGFIYLALLLPNFTKYSVVIARLHFLSINLRFK
jgi:hypothetical protein